MAGFGFIFWLIAAHSYTAEQVGVASILISAMNFITYVSLLGFNTTFIHFLPKSKKRSEEIDTGLIFVALAGILVATAYVLIVPVLSPKLHLLWDHWYIAVGFVLLVTGAASNLVTDSIFIAYRGSRYNFIINGIIASLTQIALPAALVGLGAFGIFASAGTAMTVAFFVSIFVLIKKFSYQPKIRIHRETIREVLSYSLLSYLSNLLNILPILLLPIIIINKRGEASAGYYYLAFMMANLLYSIAYALSQSVLAEGSYANAKAHIAKKTASMLALVMLPASLGLALVGPLILRIFGGNYSTESQSLLYVLAASGPFVAAYVFGVSLLRLRKLHLEIIYTNLIYAASIIVLANLWAYRGLAWIGVAWLCGNILATLAVGMFYFKNQIKQAH